MRWHYSIITGILIMACSTGFAAEPGAAVGSVVRVAVNANKIPGEIINVNQKAPVMQNAPLFADDSIDTHDYIVKIELNNGDIRDTLKPDTILKIKERLVQGPNGKTQNVDFDLPKGGMTLVVEPTESRAQNVAQTISSIPKSVNVSMGFVQMGIKGTILDVNRGTSPLGVPIAYGSVQQHDASPDGSHRQSVVDVTPKGEKTTTVSSEGGTTYFKVENGSVETSRTPFVIANNIQNEMKQATFDKSGHPTYVNNSEQVQDLYNLVNTINGYPLDFIVNLQSLANTITPANGAVESYVAGSGDFRLSGYYPTQADFYNAAIAATPGNPSPNNNFPNVSFAQTTYNNTVFGDTRALAELTPRSTRGFATDALMLSTPASLVPLLGDNIFSKTEMSPSSTTLFLNSQGVSENLLPTNISGANIQMGEWTVPLTQFADKLIFTPMLSNDFGSPAFAQSILTASPEFFWVTAPSLPSTFVRPSNPVTYFFNAPHSVFQAQDSYFRSSTAASPTATGFLTFDFRGPSGKISSGYLNITVPYDRSISAPGTPISQKNQIWNLNLMGSSVTFDRTTGQFLITNRPQDNANNFHYNPETGVIASFGWTITGTLTGNGAEATIGTFSFIDPNQPFALPGSQQPCLGLPDSICSQNGVAGVFAADRFNANGLLTYQTNAVGTFGASIPAGDYSGYLKDQFNRLPIGTDNGKEAVLALGTSGKVLTADKVLTSPNDGIIQADKMFKNTSSNTLIFNSNPVALNNNITTSPASGIEMGLWNDISSTATGAYQALVPVESADTGSGVVTQDVSPLPWVSAVPLASLASLPASLTFNFTTDPTTILGTDSFGFGSPNSTGPITVSSGGSLNFTQLNTTNPLVGVSALTFNVSTVSLLTGQSLSDTWTTNAVSPVSLTPTVTNPSSFSIPVSGTYTSGAALNNPNNSNSVNIAQSTGNISGSIGGFLTASGGGSVSIPNVVGGFNLNNTTGTTSGVNGTQFTNSNYLKGSFFIKHP